MKKLILMLALLAPMSMFAQKFGHLNSQQIMNDMPEFVKARGEIEATAKQYENDLKVNAIQAVGKAGNYVYIMDVTSGIPYISQTLSEDVTAKVKAELAKKK